VVSPGRTILASSSPKQHFGLVARLTLDPFTIEALAGVYILLSGETPLGEVHYSYIILQARQEPLCLTVT
jgi:hypothetical protein